MDRLNQKSRTIFVSYRRGPDNGYAVLIQEELRKAFADDGDAEVFFDVDTISPGADFAEAIDSYLQRSDVLVAIVGEGWEARLDRQNDWVRQEIESAQRLGVTTIPVLIDRTMPVLSGSAEMLEFQRCNAITLTLAHHRSAIHQLITAIDPAAWQTRRRRRLGEWRQRAIDVDLTVPITEKERSTGITRRRSVKLLVGCKHCEGSGWEPDSVEPCRPCEGRGVTRQVRQVDVKVPIHAGDQPFDVGIAGHRLPGRETGRVMAHVRVVGDDELALLEDGPPKAALRTRTPSKWWLPVTLALVGLGAFAYSLWRGHPSSLAAADVSTVLGRVDVAITSSTGLLPAWPSKLGAIEQWLSNARTLLASRQPIEARREALRDPVATESPQERIAVEQALRRLDVLASTVRVMESAKTWSAEVEAASLHHPGAKFSWDQVRESLRDPKSANVSARYHGRNIDLSDERVMGLVPLGIHPVTRLWEFYDLRSAWDGRSNPADIRIPSYADEIGNFAVDKHMGIVFVLLPGGTFLMGAQSKDRRAPNYDEAAESEEGPPHQVTLDHPFLLARHELTRGQWRRLATLATELDALADMGEHDDDRLPVTHVTCESAEACLERVGAVLPTEAQWEYACRAGSSSPWWCGDEAMLSAIANVGSDRLLPVGSFPPNPFGLHDIHGNVMEWCRDLFVDYPVTTESGDGHRPSPPNETEIGRVARGGDFHNAPSRSRASFRPWRILPESKFAMIGIRASRSLPNPR